MDDLSCVILIIGGKKITRERLRNQRERENQYATSLMIGGINTSDWKYIRAWRGGNMWCRCVEDDWIAAESILCLSSSPLVTAATTTAAALLRLRTRAYITIRKQRFYHVQIKLRSKSQADAFKFVEYLHAHPSYPRCSIAFSSIITDRICTPLRNKLLLSFCRKRER